MEDLILEPGDDRYPARLRQRMGEDSPVLHARGRLENLQRWTLAFMTADIEPGAVTRAVWDAFFPLLELEMNLVGAWQSVNEGVLFRSALDKPHLALTLFTALGLDQETYETFVAARHQPPQDSFVQRKEYDRRAAAGELLLLSASPPGHTAQDRETVLHRNWVACMLADAVFIGGAARKAMLWSVKARKLVGRPQKTYALARRLVGSAVPVFTVAHPDNSELTALGVRAVPPREVGVVLRDLGAPPAPPVRAEPVRLDLVGQPRESPAAEPATAKPRRNDQLELFAEEG